VKAVFRTFHTFTPTYAFLSQILGRHYSWQPYNVLIIIIIADKYHFWEVIMQL
jgi:hypothetical protein